MAGRRYDAFISHAREQDGALAGALAGGLQRLGRRWRDRVALRTFRDREAMGTEGNLPGRLHAAMDDAERFVLLACPAAAERPWVTRELGYWLETRGPTGILIVLTGGECAWDEGTNDFDRQRTTAIPAALYGQLESQPAWSDLRWVHQGQIDPATLGLRDERFADGVAVVAAGLAGVVKSTYVGEAVRRRRRQRWAAVVAGVVSVVLVAVAVSATSEAGRRRDEASAAGDLASSRALAERADAAETERLDVRLLLAVSAYDAAPTPEARAALARAVISARGIDRLLPGHAGGVADLATGPGPDGGSLVTVDVAGLVRVWDTATGELVGEPIDARADTARLDTQGRVVTVGVDLVARWYDLSSGERLAEVELGDPATAVSCDMVACDRMRVAIRDDGERVAAGTLEGQLTIAGPDGIEATATLDGPVTGIIYPPGDDGALFVADDRGIQVWSDTGEPLGAGYAHEFTGWAGLLPGGIGFSRDGDRFGFIHGDSYGNGSEMAWYDVTDATTWEWLGSTSSMAIQDLSQPVGETTPHLGAFALLPDGNGAVVATDPTPGGTPVSAVYEISSEGSWRRSAAVSRPPATVTRLAILGDDATIAVGGLDDAVLIVRPGGPGGSAGSAGSVNARLEEIAAEVGDWTGPLPDGFTSAARSPDHATLAGVYGSGSGDGSGVREVVVVDADGGVPTDDADGAVAVADPRSVTFGPSADVVVVGTGSGRVVARSRSTGATVATADLPGGPVEGLAGSPDGSWIVAITAAEVVLLDATTLARVATLVTRSGADARSDALYQAPDLGGVISSWAPGGELVFGWNELVTPAPSSDTNGPFPEQELDVESIPVFPGAEETLFGAVPPAVELDLRTDGLAATACRVANRNLARGEWDRLVEDRPYRAACPGLPAVGDELPEPLDREPTSSSGNRASPAGVPDIPEPPLDAAVPPHEPPDLPPDSSAGFPTDELDDVERYFAGYLALGALHVDWETNGPREHPYAVIGSCEDVDPLNLHDMCIGLVEESTDHAVFVALAGDPTMAYGYATRDGDGWTPTDWWTEGLGPAPPWVEDLAPYISP